MKADDAALASVAAILWDERQYLEDLLFALVSEQLVVAAGRTRWLARADAGVQEAVSRLRDGEVGRAVQVQALARALDVAEDSSLADLAQASPEPWREVFTEHRAALRALTAEIDAAVAENRRLLLAGSQAISDTLDRLGAFSGTYDSRGGTVRSAADPAILDEQA
jgi:hypothetical protein